mgnify:CR=1 FL=1
MTHLEKNAIIVASLKRLNQCHWVGTETATTLEEALYVINFFHCCINGGLYTPIGDRFAGIEGFYLINKDGTIFPASRVIKKEENLFFFLPLPYLH